MNLITPSSLQRKTPTNEIGESLPWRQRRKRFGRGRYTSAIVPMAEVGKGLPLLQYETKEKLRVVTKKETVNNKRQLHAPIIWIVDKVAHSSVARHPLIGSRGGLNLGCKHVRHARARQTHHFGALFHGVVEPVKRDVHYAYTEQSTAEFLKDESSFAKKKKKKKKRESMRKTGNHTSRRQEPRITRHAPDIRSNDIQMVVARIARGSSTTHERVEALTQRRRYSGCWRCR